MNVRTLIASLAACAASVALVSVALSQDKEKPRAAQAAAKADAPAQPDPAAAQAAMEGMNPGPMHKHLEPFVGKWNTTMQLWMAGPESEPVNFKGTSEAKWILGGRYVQDTHKMPMQMPGPDGQLVEMEMEGLGMTGYDNFKKMYVFTWADNMSTQLITGYGTFHPEKKTLTSYGTMDEAPIQVVGRTVKYVSRVVDKDTHVFQIIDLHAGDDHKVMEITYKRAK